MVPVLGALGSYATDLDTKASWLFNAWGSPQSQGLATVNIGDYLGSGINKSDPSVTTDDVIKGFLQVRRLQTRVAGNLPTKPVPGPSRCIHSQGIANMSTTSPMAYGSASLAHFAASSAYWGLALHAYEGGPDTSGGTAATLMALANACKDSRMTAVVTGIVSNWQSWGAGMFNFFIISAQPLEQPWGSYSHLWDMRVTTTPKSQALDRIVSTPPSAVSAGWPIPVVNHSASFYVGYYSKDGLPPANPVITWLPPGTEMQYLIRVGSPSPCSLGINVTVLMSNSNAKGPSDPLGVSVGVFLPSVNVTAPVIPKGAPKFAASTPALFPPLPPAALPNGLISVRLQVVTPIAPNFELLGLYVSCRAA